MKLVDESNLEKYNEFLKKHDRCNFQQSIEWGKVKAPAWKNEVVLAEDKDGNIWFGTSISSQETFNEYVPLLIKNTPKKAKLFLSIEPQTEDVNISSKIEKVKWIIQGGESGFKRRGFDVLWAYKIKKYCKDFNIPYFFKQIYKKIEIPTDLQIREFPNF